jgi:maleylacetate reductase
MAAVIAFRFVSAAQQVIFGAGSLDGLGDAIFGFGWERVLLCTIPRFRSSGLVNRVAETLGERLAAVYAEAEPHVPEAQVDAATALAYENKVDAVIGLGGGSPIGLAKAVSLALEEKRIGRTAFARSPTEQPLVPVIAVPTTYAGSEMTPIYGVTRDVDGTPRKVTVSDPKVTPKLVIYDPVLTLDLPPEMTASSGINALAHCVEAVYSTTRNPVATAAALAGTRLIYRNLPAAVAKGDDLDARTGLLEGAYLAATAIATARIGLHHGLCHALGGTVGMPHGIANAVMLPHAMRFNSRGVAEELAMIAHAIGLSGDNDTVLAERVCRAVNDLIASISLPQRLRDVGVMEADLPGLAEAALLSKAIRANPVEIAGPAEIEAIYRAAF